MIFDVDKLRGNKTAQGRVRRWIAALRSGEFGRARGRLKDITPGGHVAYCCLGVACHLASPDGWGGDYDRAHKYGSLSTEDPGDFNERVNYLSARGAGLFALTTQGVEVLAKLNDQSSSTFDSIAALIESDFNAALAAA